MKDKADRIFYDVIYLEDDGGWYCEVWDGNCQELFTTDIFSLRNKAERKVKDKYPQAELMRVFE